MTRRARTIGVWLVATIVIACAALLAGSGASVNGQERCAAVMPAGTASVYARGLSWPARTECRFVDSRCAAAVQGGATSPQCISTRRLWPAPSAVALVLLLGAVVAAAVVWLVLGVAALGRRARRAAPG